jgi:putative SOS response-associated peptidase YedK
MCARAKLITDVSEIKLAFQIPGPPINVPARWNGAPTHDFPVLRRNPQTRARSLDLLRWGLVPRWAKGEKVAYATINAKAETLATTPSFREAWRGGRRCIIPLDAFYEWKTLPDGRKQPFAVSRVDGRMLVVAGLWEGKTLPDGTILRTFTIITTAANAALAPLHDRMPVILAEADIPLWLGEIDGTLPELLALLRPCPAEWLTLTEIDPRMSNVRNQDAAFCQPVLQQVMPPTDSN